MLWEETIASSKNEILTQKVRYNENTIWKQEKNTNTKKRATIIIHNSKY